MSKPFRGIALALTLAGLPSMAAAQRRAPARQTTMEHGRHELGVDVGFTHVKPSGGSGAFVIGTPLDVRLGFPTSGRMQVEPRFAFTYVSGGGDNAYVFTPDVNLLFAMGGNERHGPYLTAGAGVALDHAKISGVSTSASQFSINGGVGTRVPYESGAIRLEGFARYLFENAGKGLPKELDIGARVGLSLWH